MDLTTASSPPSARPPPSASPSRSARLALAACLATLSRGRWARSLENGGREGTSAQQTSDRPGSKRRERSGQTGVRYRRGCWPSLRPSRPGAARFHADVLFHIGLAGDCGGCAEARHFGDKTAGRRFLDEAIAVLRQACWSIRPGLFRVRLELARAFFFKGEDTLARRHFERVLGRQAAGGGGRSMSNRILGAVCGRASAGASAFGVALAPDSNISSANGRADDPV